MTSSFIKSTLDSRNEFRVESEFTLFNTKIVNSNLKIDTGCGFTTFPLRTLGTFTLAEIQKYKLNDIKIMSDIHSAMEWRQVAVNMQFQ